MIEFGQKIIVNERLIRRSRMIENRRHKVWVPRTITQTECIVIGFRTLHNGITYWDDEDGYQFHSKEKFRALLVVANSRENPFYIEQPKGGDDERIQD